jgi:hypothetical protein
VGAGLHGLHCIVGLLQAIPVRTDYVNVAHNGYEHMLTVSLLLLQMVTSQEPQDYLHGLEENTHTAQRIYAHRGN